VLSDSIQTVAKSEGTQFRSEVPAYNSADQEKFWAIAIPAIISAIPAVINIIDNLTKSKSILPMPSPWSFPWLPQTDEVPPLWQWLADRQSVLR
jgi:hypothetical protein